MGVQMGERILPLVLMKSSWGFWVAAGTLPPNGDETTTRFNGAEVMNGSANSERDATGERFQCLPCQDRYVLHTHLAVGLKLRFIPIIEARLRRCKQRLRTSHVKLYEGC